jgi:peroxiredoxin
MPRTRRVLILAGLLLLTGWLLLALSGKLSNSTGNSTESLYASSFVNKMGTPQPISQWHGKILVVNFWASWCPPCLEEMPSLNQFHQQYQAKGVQVVGISTEDINALKKFEQQLKLDYPLLAGDAEAMSLAQSLGNDRSILPFTVIIDKSGKIAQIVFGKLEKTTLEKVVTPLL